MRGLLLAFLAVPLFAVGDISGTVVSVTDGDTIKVLDNKNIQYNLIHQERFYTARPTLRHQIERAPGVHGGR